MPFPTNKAASPIPGHASLAEAQQALQALFRSKQAMIHPDVCKSLVNGDITLGPAAQIEGDAKPAAGSYIAIVPVSGILLHHKTWLEEYWDVRSYESLQEDLEQALDNAAVSAIVLDINSPGGLVSGCFDFCDWLKAQRGRKPIYAIARDHAYSAAYAVAACADKLFVAQAGGVGSIGVKCEHYDISGMLAEWGVKITEIVAGAKKNLCSIYQPLSDEGRAEIQASIDSAYDIFVRHVAEGRGITEDTVRGTEAGCFEAPAAISLGLADGVSTLDDVCEQVFAAADAQESGPSARLTQGPKAKGATMFGLKGRNNRAEQDPPKDEEEDKTIEDTEDDDKDSAEGDDDVEDNAEDDQEDDAAEGDDEEENTSKAFQSGYAAALEIANLCAVAKKPELTRDFLKKGLSVDQARKSLQASRKTKPASDIKGAHRGSDASGDSLIAKAKAKYGKKGA